MSPDKAAVLLDQLTKTPREGHDAEWLDFAGTVLHLPPCYVPAAQEILRQGAWRRHTGRGQNPIGYVKTATEREGLRMGLATHRHDRTEPRVPTKDQPQKRALESRTEELRFDHLDKMRGRVRLAVPDGVTYSDHIDQLQGTSSSGMPTKTGRGTWHQGSGEPADDYDYREIPDWLTRDGEDGAVDWETVAKYAVLKPHMAPALAKTLRLRFEDRMGRPAALRAASSPSEEHEIEAAWKWIDRCWRDRIAPLFQMEGPPWGAKTYSASGARKAPLKAPGQFGYPGTQLKQRDRLRDLLDEIGVRPDVLVGWNGCRLSLRRNGSEGLEIEGTFTEALEELRIEAIIGDFPGLFVSRPFLALADKT